ncbi:MAG: FKBP-type peptidyl-prolyl cis-trans isomerase [Flavobacteriales bacterium]|nr:FKBP-type peptidyl-prolyl cis-trans isomerase [Flavobacteriales bacterium]
MKRIVIISLLAVALFSCENKFPDYTQKEDDVYLKLLSFEESNKSSELADHAIVSVEITGEEGLLYKHYKADVVSLKNNELTFLIQYLKEGDSCSFMVSKEKIIEEFKPITFNETTSKFVEVNIKVHQFFTKGEYLSQRQAYDKEMMEQLLLTKYLEEVNTKFHQGIYTEQLTNGEGKKVANGDVITISYKGYFINRLEFDKISGATAFTFTYGTPGQVIKGLDIAIKGMKKGEKSKIIIPSQLAFGEEGSTTRVVPPFTTVIYELEIVNVK